MSTIPLPLQSDDEPPWLLSPDSVTTHLAQEGNIEWLLYHSAAFNETFCLATASAEKTHFQVAQLLKKEFFLRHKLSSQWALKPVGHTLFHGKYALIYPAFPYRTLADSLDTHSTTLPDFLHCAIKLCQLLTRVHHQGLVHADIKPANIFIKDNGDYLLGGFGLASVISNRLQQTRRPATGGTLAYMSPEHTARTLHPVTSVSDLYSLGMMLYERLTGQLPFGTREGSYSEWVHHHIASEPTPPHLLRADVPVIVSSIIMCLLSKSPEQRYQTVEGLEADLLRCLSTMTPGGDIESFTPGMQDVAQKWSTPESLFFNHPQAKNILNVFDQLKASGTQSLIVVSGITGSGKSSLLASSLKKLQPKKILLSVVKAEQHSPVLPYAVIISAFRTLIMYLLGLPSEEAERWRTHFIRLLGDYTGLAVHFIPELGNLLGKAAQIPAETNSLDARDKFYAMACNMIKAFAAPGRPLVIFIDDIHWADRGSLQLLQHILSLSEDIPLLVVIAHQDIQSLPCPLVGTQLRGLRASASQVVDITPAPLSVKKIARYLAGTFHTRSSVTSELAQIIYDKTAGNPLFTHEFFRQAVQDGLISHQNTSAKWCYDRAALEACQYSENVAVRVLQQIETIPLRTKIILGGVACLGGSGALSLLSKVLELTPDELKAALLPAISAQLISLTATEFAFTHDRVHRAALSLNNSEEKDLLHNRAARCLIGMAGEDITNEALFRAVHHLAAIENKHLLAFDLTEIRELIFRASRQAKNTGDYVSSLRFLMLMRSFAIPMTSEEEFTLTLEEAECEFLNGNLSNALLYGNKLLSMSGHATDKAVAVCLMAEAQMRQSDHGLALETAINGLAVFGINLNLYPDKAECDAARIILKADVGKNPYTRFRTLPLLENRETEAILNLMARASMFAAFVRPRLHFMIICKMLHLTMAQGITGASTFALSWYGVLCGDHYDEYSRGFASTLLARELVYRHDFTSYKACTLLPLDQVSIWTMPVTYAIECAKTTFEAAVANGDRTSACLALRHLAMNYLARGDHLEGVQTSIERGLAYVRKAQYKDVEAIMQMQRDYVLFLRTPSVTPLTGNDFSPPSVQDICAENAIEPMLLIQFWFWLYKGMAHFFAGEYQCASHCFGQAEPLTGRIPGHTHMVDFHLYSALAITIRLQPQEYTTEVREKISRHFEKIAVWATENKNMFADKAALLSAEMLRLEDKPAQASGQYEIAITCAREGQFNHINGLAHELAAKFAEHCGLHVAAEAYTKGAISAWERWGANAKVRQLEIRFPHLASSASSSAFNTVNFDQRAELSDLQSVITAVRALTEEINLDRLINTLMMMLLERAGAQHCMLIRLTDGNVPEIEARATSNNGCVKVRIVRETPVATDLPLSVLSAVIRTGKEIRTGKPEVFSPFSQDPYLVASGAAVMCVPMFKQARMVGILYLENRLMPDVFTAEHSRVIAMLGAQAAVSLETARLYEELLEENIHRRRVEKQLRTSQTSLMLGEKISHTGTWHWHLKQDMMLISNEYTRILGLSEQQNTLSMADFLTRVHPDDYHRISQLVQNCVLKGISMQAEFRIIRSDGDVRFIKGIGDPVKNWPDADEYFGTISDITAQRKSEDAVRSAQADLARVSRATTVGQLTASIAHELNQPLMSIVANAGASLRWLKRGPQHLLNASDSLQEIINEGKRAGDIIRGLQSLTRNHVSEFAPANLHDLASDILSLSRRELETRWISLEQNFIAENANIICDRVQIQQVLLNLVINAIDAMSETHERSRILSLSSSNPTADTLCFEVSDTGTGLADDDVGRLFESFFTTKENGMGMGLTISHGIIKKHRGELKAGNRNPCGSTFWFTLPVVLNKENV